MRLFAFLLLFIGVAFGHEGHTALLAEGELGRPTSWWQWIGAYHVILVHFPIGLIVFTAIAELLFTCTKNPLYDSAAKFMLTSAAIIILPIALLGLIYSRTGTYEGVMGTILTLHMLSGVALSLLTIATAYVRAREGRSYIYLTLIVILFLLVLITGYLGGSMVYGPFHFLPPS